MFILGSTIKYEYDDEEDILYISIENPKPAITEEIEEGILIRKDIKTKEIIGVTILDYKDRLNKKEEIKVPKIFDLTKIKI